MSTATQTHETEVVGPDEVEKPELVGLLAEFPTVDAVAKAARIVRRAGFTRWDVHSPFPIHGIDYAMGIRPTILPWIVLGAGLFGLCGGLLLQWWVNAWDYPFYISGKPLWSLPANIPVTYETTVLCSAFTAGLGMLALNGLPRWSNPIFKSERFRKATDDRFFVVIDATDKRFDESGTTKLLQDAGAVIVERVED